MNCRRCSRVRSCAGSTWSIVSSSDGLEQRRHGGPSTSTRAGWLFDTTNPVFVSSDDAPDPNAPKPGTSVPTRFASANDCTSAWCRHVFHPPRARSSKQIGCTRTDHHLRLGRPGKRRAEVAATAADPPGQRHHRRPARLRRPHAAQLRAAAQQSGRPADRLRLVPPPRLRRRRRFLARPVPGRTVRRPGGPPASAVPRRRPDLRRRQRERADAARGRTGRRVDRQRRATAASWVNSPASSTRHRSNAGSSSTRCGCSSAPSTRRTSTPATTTSPPPPPPPTCRPQARPDRAGATGCT